MAQPLRWPRRRWDEIEEALSADLRLVLEQRVSNLIIEAVEEWLVKAGDDPNGPLRELAILRLHRDLADMADHQIVHFAARAREQGLPWSAITAAIRLSHPETTMSRWGEAIRAEQARMQDQST
ncbi:MAG: hypothetical protein M0Z42_10185 [Actinomycetota bacterium]|jgi:hypothetical protein|nr:hypothetical protein [Actinomycetota bacterium]